ncbi:hypothetical protein JKP88DRAFT_266655 [Tribonema minus]|uniref:Nucleolar protein 12 n=1 Tax=Tribonema minus TaxID=303371 RepID=A0A836CPQ3_9STRA|nr:hypothetical protein JKP88DRAFT_266655 [Tribonema minus]
MGGGDRKKGKKRPITEISFDPEARTEYLQGFHKRKQERRRFGLAMQQIKDRKERLEERKEKRVANQEKLDELGLGSRDLGEFDMKAQRRKATAADPERGAEVVDFADDATRAMFGGDVTVTTTFGIAPGSDDEEDGGREGAEGGGGGGGASGAGHMDEELREHKRAKLARHAQDAHWSLAAVTRRVAAKMPTKKRHGGGGGRGSGGDVKHGSGKAVSRELLARAKGSKGGGRGGGRDGAEGGKGKGKGKGRGGGKSKCG